MDANSRNLGEIFDRKIRLTAPLFQRPYVWNEERNWQPLWDSILDVAERRLYGKKQRPRFLGAIVLAQLKTKTGEVETRQVIDGQQRLTTLQLTLAAMRDVIRTLGDEDYERSFTDLTRNHVPSKKTPDNVFKFWPTNRDRGDFKKTLSAGSLEKLREAFNVPESANSCGSLIPDAYLFFYNKTAEWLNAATVESSEDASEEDDTLERRLECLLDAMRRDIQLVVIDLGEEDDPQMIFETLNALGTPLLPADLIKNFLFHQAQNEKADLQELYERSWKPFEEDSTFWRKEIQIGRLKRPQIDVFIQHYLALKTQDEAVATNLFGTFKDYILDNGKGTAAEHLDEIRQYAKVYRSFAEFDGSSPEGRFFYRLDLLDTTTAYPFLLEVFKSPKSKDDLLQIIRDLESYFVRRAICGWTTKNYNRLFADLIKRCGTEGFNSEVLRNFLMQRSGEAGKWPSDKELKWSLLESPIYKKIVRRRARMVLEAIELAMFEGKTENIQINEKLTIEHILPQKWQENWPLENEEDEDERDRLLHTIGNLTLVTGKLNPSMSNAGWKKKKAALLEHSALTMNRKLKDHNQWDEEQTRSRSKRLFKAATEIWERPEGGDDNEIIIPDQASIKTAREKRELRSAYWGSVANEVNGEAFLPKPIKPTKRSHILTSFGRKGFRLSPYINFDQNLIGVSLICAGKNGAANFQKLLVEKDTIESEIGEQLTWGTDEDPNEVSLRWHDVNCYDESHWQAQHQWMVEKLELFYNQFDMHCQALAPMRSKNPELAEQRFKFWKTFRNKVIQEAEELRPRRANQYASLRFSLNNPAFRMDARTTKQGDEVRVDLVCRRAKFEGDMDSLRSAMNVLQEDHGVEVEWKEFDQFDQTKIIARKTFDVASGWEDVWAAQHDWLLDVLCRYQEVFGELARPVESA